MDRQDNLSGGKGLYWMQGSKARKERVLRKLSSPSKLRELQRNLYHKAQADPRYSFYSLYDKSYRRDVLAEAYRRVKAKRGASGIVGCSLKILTFRKAVCGKTSRTV